MFLYIFIFIVTSILILKRIITKRKKHTYTHKDHFTTKESLKYIQPTENVPYLKYTKDLKYDIIKLNTGETINKSEMFFIEKGSVIITHEEKFVCKKQQNDFYFYALDFFGINKENVHIIANEPCVIWKIDKSKINTFVLLTSIKKKVIDVLVEQFDYPDLFIENELELNKLFFTDKVNRKFQLQHFMLNILNFKKNFSMYTKVLSYTNNEVIKKKEIYMENLFLIEEGTIHLKYNDKVFYCREGNIFGYFSLFFNCYRKIEIKCEEPVILKAISYEYLIRSGLDLQNFRLEYLKNFCTIIHYIDLCTDWRIFRINDTIANSEFCQTEAFKKIIYLNEGSLQKKDNTLIVKRLSDIIYIDEYIIRHMLHFDINFYKKLHKKTGISKNNKIVSVLPNNNDTNIRLFSKRLKASIGKDCLLLDKKDFFLSFDISEELRVSEFLNRLSRTHSLILINVKNKFSRLAKFLHEFSDVVLVVGYGWDINFNTTFYNDKNSETDKNFYTNVEFVKLYEQKPTQKSKPRNDNNLNCLKIHNILSPNKTILFSSKDYDRLSRYLMNKRIGLVLSGGGARGIAHIGVIQALEEENIPIDIIGGSSMGAFIGALYCKECDNGFVFLKAKQFCSRANSLLRVFLDLTFPLMSLFRGETLNNGLKKIFKNDLIQNLWIEYFCVTTNLFTNEEEVHISGLAWKFIRASMGLCGYVPPIIDSKGYLVDGGYLNNVPADIMLNMNVSKIIAVDVGTIEENDYDEHEECFNGFVGLIHKFFDVRKYITMQEIQYRLSFLTSEKKLKALEKNNQVFVMRPELEDIHTMDFKKFDKIVATGYSSAKKILKEWKSNGIFDTHFNQNKNKLRRRRYSV